MGIPFIPIRKSGKLPGETLRCKYDLEYGSAEVEVHKSDIKKGWNVVVHDDLLATGGTACAASELMKELEVKVVAFAFIISFLLSAVSEHFFFSENVFFPRQKHFLLLLLKLC